MIPNDFALWKASDGNPKRDSPWVHGPPGWHIECSTMATSLLGDHMDIHSSGIDLIFPHHTNEMLQAYAWRNKKNYEWVDHFWHSGHLNIDGLKMSKSLKNFITIKDALDTHTPRQIRLMFVIHKWNEPMDYSTNNLENAAGLEKRIVDFYPFIPFTREKIDPSLNGRTATTFVIPHSLTFARAYIIIS